ncbi:MAG: Nif3-like dinuclear metal center hexameric protein [Nanoarchaeota archaeon]|nr:Nif3-like dinuclear metal center hexameric protein [Nanoarchaeota archaeon]
MVSLRELVSYSDDLLRVREIEDKSLNGLQISSDRDVKQAAFAVDASVESIESASQADILFVHHGLFWGIPKPLTGSLYFRIRAAIKNGLALYAAHLPLDAHPVLGNNAQLLKLLGLKQAGDFGRYESIPLGKIGTLEKAIPLSKFVSKINSSLGTRSIVAHHGPTTVKRIGIISGDGSYALEEVKRLGLDALLTGETQHIAIPVAKELGLNIIFAGHYATETLGLKALAGHLKKKFKISTAFIDLPTGL